MELELLDLLTQDQRNTLLSAAAAVENAEADQSVQALSLFHGVVVDLFGIDAEILAEVGPA